MKRKNIKASRVATLNDINDVRLELRETAQEIVQVVNEHSVTKEEFGEFKQEMIGFKQNAISFQKEVRNEFKQLRNDFLTSLDRVMGELKTIRQAQIIQAGQIRRNSDKIEYLSLRA